MIMMHINLQGSTILINGKEILVKGAVLAVLANTQAAHLLGGFKVGVGFSLRRCRNCLATKDSMSMKVYGTTTPSQKQLHGI